VLSGVQLVRAVDLPGHNVTFHYDVVPSSEGFLRVYVIFFSKHYFYEGNSDKHLTSFWPR
jgi:hypothetical protein